MKKDFLTFSRKNGLRMEKTSLWAFLCHGLPAHGNLRFFKKRTWKSYVISSTIMYTVVCLFFSWVWDSCEFSTKKHPFQCISWDTASVQSRISILVRNVSWNLGGQQWQWNSSEIVCSCTACELVRGLSHVHHKNIFLNGKIFWINYSLQANEDSIRVQASLCCDRPTYSIFYKYEKIQ